MAIGDFMTQMHRACDRHFADAETAIAQGDWTVGAAHFARFRGALERHFEAEETILFPAFEEETGGEMGPTRVMSIEHLHMRDLVLDLAKTLERRDAAGYLELSDTLAIMLRQHNIKEEQALYPMMDEALGERSEALRAELEDLAVED